MKSKEALKMIVKECLLEILAEGLSSNKNKNLSETFDSINTKNNNQVKSQVEYKRTDLRQNSNNRFVDNITKGIKNETSVKQSETKINESIKKKITSLTNDALMSELLADTAMTTLREQAENPRDGMTQNIALSGDNAAKVVSQSDPMDLFGESASNWANLAFVPSIRK